MCQSEARERMRARSATLGPVVVALCLAGAAHAQLAVRSIDLGDGMQVTLISRPAGVCGPPGVACALWSAVGLDIARMDALLVARTYVRVPGSPRVLAAIPPMPVWALSTWRRWPAASVLYTDDRGASWAAARWPAANVAEAIAFSEDGALGVAVGASQGIWSSEDRGLTWIERSSSAGLRYVDVAVLGRAVVIVDEGHAAWVSRDRGFSLASAADEVSGGLRVTAEAIVIPTERGEVRIDHEGRRVR